MSAPINYLSMGICFCWHSHNCDICSRVLFETIHTQVIIQPLYQVFEGLHWVIVWQIAQEETSDTK